MCSVRLVAHNAAQTHICAAKLWSLYRKPGSHSGATAGESCQGDDWAAGAQAASGKAEQAAAGCWLCIQQRSSEQHKAPDACR